MGGYEVVAVSTIWKWSPDQIEKIRVGHGLAKRHVAGHDAGSSVGFITPTGSRSTLTIWHCFRLRCCFPI